MAIVKVSELQGVALDWAVARAEAYAWEIESGAYGSGMHVVIKLPEPSIERRQVFKPSKDWAQGGLLIKKYNVMLSPPTSAVHRNYGYMDKRNGYEEAGFWGTTIFAKERKHRRAAFHHKDDPLIPAMQAIVQLEFGDEIEVPDELISAAA